MKLYYLPGACSLASHIILREAKADFDIIQVEKGTGRTVDGEDYRAVNPLGYVPALQTPDAGTMVENGAILPYLADRFALTGSAEKYKLLEEIAYLSSELHKAYSPFFKNPDLSGDARETAEQHLHSRLKRYEQTYASEELSVATVYAFVITGWSAHAGIFLDDYPRITAMRAAFLERPAVKAAMTAEGLL